jgi:hypothetical protein
LAEEEIIDAEDVRDIIVNIYEQVVARKFVA